MNYATITKQDMLNGDGIRAVFWVTGCSHHCKGCHNPETWDENYGKPVTKDTYKELALALEPDYISGVTWSGGDPLYCGNRKELENLIMFVHDNFQKTQWLYTGFLWEDIKDLEIIKYIDVLIDGPYIEEQRNISLKWRGSSNQRVIDVQKSLKLNKVVLYCD